MEFEVTTDLSVLPAVIECNAEEVKAQLVQALEKYKTLAVTPETMKQAKTDKADLNKLRTAIEERRKEIKRQCLAPYDAFEAKCKEITALIDEPIGMIDTQLKAIAEDVVKQKYSALEQFYNQISDGQDISWIELNRILNPKWRNATVKLGVLQQEIYDTVKRMCGERAELEKIYGSTPLYTAIWGKYLETYDKGQTLAYAAVLMQQEQQRQIPMPEPVSVSAPMSEPPPMPQEQLGTCAFRVTGTREQIMALRDFMKQNRIRFETLR